MHTICTVKLYVQPTDRTIVVTHISSQTISTVKQDFYISVNTVIVTLYTRVLFAELLG